MIRPFNSFLDAIATANQLSVSGNVQWMFFPGMLFGSHAKWWDDFAVRTTCHEGVDIRFYRTPECRMACLVAGSRIPAWDRGMVLNICRDFLGYSIVVEHEKNQHTRFIYVIAHIHPDKNLALGDRLKPDDVIAAIADTSQSRLAPHLHVSVMEIPLATAHTRLNWDLFTDSGLVNLINPAFI